MLANSRLIYIWEVVKRKKTVKLMYGKIDQSHVLSKVKYLSNTNRLFFIMKQKRIEIK